MKNKITLITIIFAITIILLNINQNKQNNEIESREPIIEYGIPADSFVIKKGIIKENQVLGEILYLHHINHKKINNIVKKSKGIFDFRKAVPGKKYTVLCTSDSIETAQYFIYEETPISYIVFDLREKIDVYRGKKKTDVVLKTSSGEIIEADM